MLPVRDLSRRHWKEPSISWRYEEDTDLSTDYKKTIVVKHCLSDCKSCSKVYTDIMDYINFHCECECHRYNESCGSEALQKDLKRIGFKRLWFSENDRV